MSAAAIKSIGIFVLCLLFCENLSAHNGSVAYAYPVGNIKVDGDLSDWPKNIRTYKIGITPSDTKPKNDADFSGYFQVGYNLANQSLYVAFTITDDDYVEDTSKTVRWDTQDGLEVSLDARHLISGSGVASFMYSNTLRTVNNAFYDAFASKASWDMMEVAMVRHGNTRIYEWRMKLGNELAVGKSIGFDFHVYDKDSDGSFSWSAWGKGEAKYRNPNSLGDIVFLPAGKDLSAITGKITWSSPQDVKLPGLLRLIAVDHPGLWITAAVDSLGNYTVMAPAGKYQLALPDPYYQSADKIYAVEQPVSVNVTGKPGQKVVAPDFRISAAVVPDLIPEKGVLQDFSAATAGRIDHFIETYQQYYGIPGVSLALIKDGKMVYHKVYGVTNTMTGEKVNDNTLFEAASVTKPVFAFAVERLAERGVIDLDRPLYEYLPNKDIEYDDRYKLMTARHVLTHRTGFPNWRWMNKDGKLDLKFTPGTAYNYSGEGFEYLKLVVEKITGKKVEQVLQEEVLGPIGLYHTFFSKNDSLQNVAAYGHIDKIPTPNDLPEKPGMAYSMYTEAGIFTKFMLYLLEQKGLTPATYDSILSRHSDYPASEAHYLDGPAYMGMSLQIRETPFGKTFGHGGNNGDFKCRFEVYKDLKMGYVIFTNSNTSDVLLENMHRFLVEGKKTTP
ncbi:serine hydrolase [Chitinophaga sp. Cy-1792]|uniref:serine hydrolase n=1 Tax=Chitinophaga sp. Cy-1792 TaxID=2608339 RepID=UPI00142470D8|nr:serine hydrolase [Chitinophaga sp. Cy-1792]NIG55793.1 serine hydrolase [Chitinophaga sp. Cy-1792]